MKNNLPISAYESKIIESVNNSAVTIISADTGSGKSTQVPQYLLNAGYEVVVTEPRRVAACSLAQRVAEEMEDAVGNTVGYRTAFERMDSENTSILYCTDGLELVRTLTEQRTSKRKVLVIDEVHEWNLNIETLVAWAKLKISEGWNTKVVIMSATFECQELKEYFGDDANVLEIPGQLFPVSFCKREKHELIPCIKDMIFYGRNTLVFVPGKKEIAEVIDALFFEKAVVLPLHGELPYEEQKKCFATYNCPKVVVATNVAQTSITIPDIDAVVDTGLERRAEVYDGIQGLFLRDVSQADITQRKGRAGRTKEGIYILCSDTSFEERPEYGVPEIKRSILDQVVLRLAATGIDAAMLEFFHNPNYEEIKNSKEKLITLGALDNDLNVSFLGYKMAKMPVSVESARMIIEAEKYGVVEEVTKIASILEVGSLLMKGGKYWIFTNERKSDLLAELDIFNKLVSMPQIDFEELQINKRNFFKIREHYAKMQSVLSDFVEFSSNPVKREEIRKSCIVGMLTTEHVFSLIDEYGGKKINNNSCISQYSPPRIVVGKVFTIQCKDRWGGSYTLDLINMVTGTTVEEIKELAPTAIREEDSTGWYDPEADIIEVPRTVYFKDTPLSIRYVQVENHPDHEQLKEEYLARRAMQFANEPERQKNVIIDGKSFDLHYDSYSDTYMVTLDDDTLYNASVNTVILNNGRRVHFTHARYTEVRLSISELRNAVEQKRINNAWTTARESLKKSCKKINYNTLDNVIPLLGKTVITHTNGGNGDEICAYACISLKNNSLQLELLEEEAEAEAKTQEAVKFLFENAILEKYPAKKFKVFSKAKEPFTIKEGKAKSDFDKEFREIASGIDITNIVDSIAYMDEIFEMLIQDLTA